MARGVLVSRTHCVQAVAPDAAVRRCPPPARLGRVIAECGRHMACLSRAIATRRRRYPMLPCGAVIRQLSWECNCRARTARGELVSHDRDAPAAAPAGAPVAAVWRCPLPAHLGMVRAELIRHMACSSHAIAMRRLLHSVHRAALPSASSAGEGAWRAQMARASGVIISRDRDMPVVALGAALRRYPPPVLLGRATAESGRHMVCSSRVIATRQGSTRCCRAALPSASLAGSVLAERGQHLACSSRVIAMRLRQPPKLPYGVALRKLSRGERLQSADDTWRVCLAQPRNAGCST